MQHLLLQQSSFTLHTSPTCLHFCKDFRIVSTLWKGSWLRSCLIPYSSEGYEKQIDCNKKSLWSYSGYLWYENYIYTFALDGCGKNTVYRYCCNNKEYNFSFLHLQFDLHTYSMIIFVSFSFPWIPSDVIKGHIDFLSIWPMTQKD